MPVTEIAWFKSTPAFQADHSLLNDLVTKLRKLDGLLSTHIGFQTEDPSVAYLLNVWDSLEHHSAITKHASYGEIFGALAPAAADSSKVEILVVESTTAPDDALVSATTEIATAALKAGAQRSELASVFDALAASNVSGGYHWGPISGKENTFVALVGWESVEAHHAAVQNPAYSAILAKAGPLVDATAVHVKFWKA